MAPLAGVLAVDTATLGIAAFFLVGLLGGAHCIGMCGPLVSVYAREMGDPDRLTPVEVRQHALFNLGRTAGYAAVGAACGALGMALVDAAGLAAVADPVRGVVGVVAGVVVMGAGARYVAGGAVGHDLPLVGDAVGRVAGVLTARVEAWAGGPKVVVLGVAHAAMPCPLLYPAYLAALATGSPTRGALSLAALGLGTVPAVFLVGTAMGRVTAGTRTKLHRALGAAFLLLGLLPLVHGLGVLGVAVPAIAVPAVAALPGVTG